MANILILFSFLIFPLTSFAELAEPAISTSPIIETNNEKPSEAPVENQEAQKQEEEVPTEESNSADFDVGPYDKEGRFKYNPNMEEPNPPL